MRLGARVLIVALSALAVSGIGPLPATASPAPAPAAHRMARHAGVAAAAVSASNVGAMATLGGEVQHTSSSYAIFWSPPGSTMSANYQSVIQSYLRDVGGSPYYAIATQYGDASGLIRNVSTFGGSWLDSAAFPAGRGPSSAPLTDADVQGAVNAALHANPSWGPPDVTKTFMVFLPLGVYLSQGGATSFTTGGFCAYHSYFMAGANNTVYAAMPYAATDAAGCGRPGPWPNQAGDPQRPGDADIEVNLVSHEQLEAVTDPLLTAWGFPSSSPIAGYEIGDVCLGINGPRQADGSNVTLNGHPYLLQTEWSNADAPPPNDTRANGCVLARSGSAAAAAPSTVRLSGADRLGTAIAISNDLYPRAGSAGAVVLSRADGFADALAGTPLAAAKHAPLLLTPAGAPLDAGVATEINRVLAPGATVYILGGTSAIASTVDAQLSPTFRVVRLAGTDRFATAVAIADTGLANPATQLLATGRDFPDALSGGAAAASTGGAVLLTDGSVLPPATANYLAAHPGTRWALGGPAAAAASGLSVTPIVGSDRYDTAVRTAQAFFSTPAVVGVASGQSFPDALGGGVHAAAHHAPLLLVAPDQVPAPVQSYLASIRAGAPSAFVYGGPSAVSDATVAAVTAAL
ncbi:MAG: hypothetical protein NVS1B12_11750 [Acidimicrobiales bacterium]